MPEILLFVNPKAGRGRALRSLPCLQDALRDEGVDTDTRLSERAGDIEHQVFEAVHDGREHIVVAGGDGSFHEAVNGLLRAGGTRIGLLPVGTGNDFAKSSGISSDAATAARALARRLVSGDTLGSFDAGVCNGRYFHNGAGIGFDARVAGIAASVRLPIGQLVYAWGILRCLIEGIATPSMTIHADGEPVWQGPATLVNVSNGRWVGSRFLIAPDADPGDGLLDLVMADAVTRRRVVSLLPLLLDGRHVDAPEVMLRRIRSLRVECVAPIVGHLDGEVQPAVDTFDMRCLEGALELL